MGNAMGGMMRRGAPEWAGQPDEVTTLLGITADEIRAERLAGKSLAQIAAARGVSKDKLISTILDARKAGLATLVAAGKLTQAQADLMADHMTDMIKTMVEGTGVGRPSGMGMGRDGAGEGRGGMRQGRGMHGGMGRGGTGLRLNGSTL
jgi:small ligand-binding sensory domain FIST